MAKITILFGVLLVGLGAYGYFGAEVAHRSVTAWIPAFVGFPMIICGLIALHARYRMAAMHVAVVFGLLGALAAGGRGLLKIGTLFESTAGGNHRAVIMVLIMFVLCAAFLVLSIKSFVDARRRRDSV